jgi:hypothetical protein
MGENSPVDTPKPGKVAGSSGNRQLALEQYASMRCLQIDVVQGHRTY